MLQRLIQRPNCLLNVRNRHQFLTALLVNLMAISHGIGVGWLSPTLRKLQSQDSPVGFTLDVNEISWVGAMLGLGAVTGNILLGCLIGRLGSKLCLLFLAFPNTCFWLLVYFAESVEYLFVARLLAGISSGGMYIVHPIFLSEISSANIRGTLSSMLMLYMNMGVLLGYILATHLPYFLITWLVICCPIAYFLSVLLFVKESPMHLIRKGRVTEAYKSFRYYKNIKDDDHEMNNEFETMRIALTKGNQLKDGLTLRDFCTPAAVKAYGIGLVLIMTNQFSCLFPMINYMSDIFAQSGSAMDPNFCSIIIGAVQILGTYGTTLLCDICGRKLLLLVSTAGVTVSLTAFGFFTHYAGIYDLREWSWVPLVLMSLYIFLGNIGLIGCFFVCLVEIFPLKIRAKAASIAIVLTSCVVSLLLLIFPLCLAHWGISATMWSCAGITGGGFCFLLPFLKETKGKSMLDD
ncbi:facilitated trehalose transporter Tret1-like isoform X2 [Drosophila tropicalis]|uniref:facilitated trehalose transporter Tret1-like isoform X2 n=1 Tax=Drosophila tropicalis TaxID=46794 RepID=UPI0035ABE5D1